MTPVMSTTCKGCGAPLDGHVCAYCRREVEVPADSGFGAALGAAMGGRYQFGWTPDWRAVYGNPAYGGTDELP